MFESVFQHTGKSVRRLSLVQYLLFEKRFIFLQMCIGLVFIYCGFALIGDKVIASMCMLFGCWLTISWKQIAYHKADTIISHARKELDEGADASFPFLCWSCHLVFYIGLCLTPHLWCLSHVYRLGRVCEQNQFCRFEELFLRVY